MAFIMALPIRRPQSGVYVLKQRLPRDLQHLRGQTVTLPIGDRISIVKIGEFVEVSLRTKEVREAKARFASTYDALSRFLDAQRLGPIALTSKEAVALSGRLYHFLIGMFGDNPGAAEKWLGIAGINQEVREGRFGLGQLLIGKDAQKKAALESRFGAVTDALLSHKQLNVDAESRSKVLRAVQSSIEHTVERLRRHAEMDYSPDPAADRFPPWSSPPGKATQSNRLSVEALFQSWATANEANKAEATIRRYRGVFASLARFAKSKSAADLSGDDIHAWAEHRRDEERVSPNSINSVDLVAVSAVYRWAMSRSGGRLVRHNPAAIDKLEEPRSTAERGRDFRTQEAEDILKLASAVEHDPYNPTSSNAKRWCPWLAAYTGARITELTALRGDDVRLEDGIPVIDIRKTKTGKPRTVPIHEHLIDQGFLMFAKEFGAKPMFFDPARHRDKTQANPAELRSRDLTRWIRSSLQLDPAVAPNHAWRHVWKTKALGVGIDPRNRDAIVGHQAGNVARKYEHPDIQTLAEAMQRFPRYNV